MTKKRLGFSLIELSVVILIIGILVIGVSKGSRVINASRLASARSLTKGSPINSMTGVILWVETSLASSFDPNIADNSAVINWYDNTQTTSKNNLSQSTASYQPIYKENVINGLPAIKFDSSDDNLMISNFELRNVGTGGFAIFAVVKKPQSGRGDFFNYKTFDGSDDFGMWIDTNFTHYLKVNGVNSITSVGGSAAIGDKLALVEVTRDYNSSYIAYVNGVQDLSLTISSDFTGIDPGTPLFIGSNHNSGFTPTGAFGGYISEIIIFNRGLKVQERKDIERYLGQKYNIKVS